MDACHSKEVTNPSNATFVTEHRTRQGCVRCSVLYGLPARNISCLMANSILQAFPVRYGSPSDVFAASSSIVHLHTWRIEEKKEAAAVVADAIVHKQGSLQWFRFITNVTDRIWIWDRTGVRRKSTAERTHSSQQHSDTSKKKAIIIPTGKNSQCLMVHLTPYTRTASTLTTYTPV
jgi:hypothetical protein